MNRVECRYADMNGYCDSTACHNMNVVGNIIPKERPENIGNSSIWVKPQSNWHTGTPTEEGDYLVAFRMSDNSVEYGWCNWNNGAWDILCDYDTTDGSCGMIAWQKIEPCNWFDFLFSEGHCDNWREVR